MCGIADILKLNSPTTSEDLSAVRRMMNVAFVDGKTEHSQILTGI